MKHIIRSCLEEKNITTCTTSEIWFSVQTNIGPADLTDIYFDTPDRQKGIMPSLKIGESKTIFACDEQNTSCFIFPEYRIA